MIRVKDLMTQDLFTVCSDNRLILAHEIMAWARIRHIPVIDANYKLVGLISHRDLLRASVSSLEPLADDKNKRAMKSIPIEKVMKKDVITISPETVVQEAARIMRDAKIGCLPVTDDQDTLLGIITEADLLYLVERMPKDVFNLNSLN